MKGQLQIHELDPLPASGQTDALKLRAPLGLAIDARSGTRAAREALRPNDTRRGRLTRAASNLTAAIDELQDLAGDPSY